MITLTNIATISSVLYAVALTADLVAFVLTIASMIELTINLKDNEIETVSDFSRREVKIKSLLISLEEIEKEEAEERFLVALDRITEAAKTKVIVVEPIDLSIEDLEEMMLIN